MRFTFVPTHSAEPAPVIESLPPLRINGALARAHTQGLEIVEGAYWVTARREDTQPRQPFLLRTRIGRVDWDVWQLPAPAASFDHPGGMQSDGRRLWIPLSESRRQGRSLIRAYALKDLQPGRSIAPEIEFAVDDHIGALAVLRETGQLLGASWDTAIVYRWDFKGSQQRAWSGGQLRQLGLGFDATHSGLTVQDWKAVGNTLVASGLWRGATTAPPSGSSRLLGLDVQLEFHSAPAPQVLDRWQGIELAREGMTVAEGWLHLLPEDLGATNRVFRFPVAALGLKFPKP